MRQILGLIKKQSFASYHGNLIFFLLKWTHLAIQKILLLIKQLKSVSVFLSLAQHIFNRCQQCNTQLLRHGHTKVRHSCSLPWAQSVAGKQQKSIYNTLWQVLWEAAGLNRLVLVASLSVAGSRKPRPISFEPRWEGQGEETYCHPSRNISGTVHVQLQFGPGIPILLLDQALLSTSATFVLAFP